MMLFDPVVLQVVKKVGGILAKPAMKKALRAERVVRVLAELGYKKLENDFESLYVHTLVTRHSQGASAEALSIFREKGVVKTFRDAWCSGDPSVFEEHARVCAEPFADVDRLDGVDVLTECRAFFAVFAALSKQALDPGHQLIANRFAELATLVTEALSALPADSADMSPARSVEVFAKYLHDLWSETYRINIKGIFSESGAGRQPVYFPIEEHYTPLRAVSGEMGQEPLTDDEEKVSEDTMRIALREREKEPVLSDFLSRSKHLLIIGDPGSGKTTFVRFVACVLAKDSSGETTAGRGEHLGLDTGGATPTPVFLRIAHLADCLRTNHANVPGGRPWTWLIRALGEQWGGDAAAVLSRRLDAGNCFVLLDGLDEVADDALRTQVYGVVNAAVEHWDSDRFMVTSRPFGYQAVAGIRDMQTVRISDFGEEEILEFIGRWGDAIYPDEDERNREAYLPQLRSAILTVPTIRQLARNPVMLTCLCVVHWNEQRLPEGKAQLLAAVLRWLLGARENERRELEFNGYFAEQCFRTLAYAMTTHSEGKQVSVDLLWATRQLSDPFRDEMRVPENRLISEARRFLESEMMFSGILVKDGMGDLRFWHLSFQEHYTGSVLVERDRADWWAVLSRHLFDPQWNEVLDYFTGSLVQVARRSVDFLIQSIIESTGDELSSIVRMAAVAGRLLKLLRVYQYDPPLRVGWQTVLDRIPCVFDRTISKTIPVADRIAAAEVLGWAGDGRFNGDEPEMLPIPGVPGVELGKYPVTVQEYARFVENGGYKEAQYWGEFRDKKEWDRPREWEEQCEHRNRPVTGISWYEAVAYCRCLAEWTGDDYRLPTSREWEAAATNPDGEYPWGKAQSTEELCNFDGNVGCPTPVGVYPSGTAPGGHLDMAGNVWEWCQDVDEDFSSSQIVCGGAWIYSARGCRSAVRSIDPPGRRGGDLGFRLSRSVS